jgi:hypothetical protein
MVALIGCTGPSTGDKSAVAEGGSAAMTNDHRIAIADSVRRTLDAFSQAVATMNADQIASFYADDPDMRWIEDGEVRYRSPGDVAAAIRAAGQNMTGSKVLYDGTEVTAVAPGVAILVTGFAQQYTTIAGDTGGFAGAITAVMVHRGDRWLFLSGHTSSAGNRAE